MQAHLLQNVFEKVAGTRDRGRVLLTLEMLQARSSDGLRDYVCEAPAEQRMGDQTLVCVAGKYVQEQNVLPRRELLDLHRLGRRGEHAGNEHDLLLQEMRHCHLLRLQDYDARSVHLLRGQSEDEHGVRRGGPPVDGVPAVQVLQAVSGADLRLQPHDLPMQVRVLLCLWGKVEDVSV